MAERPNERTAKVKPEESESERKGAGHLAATTARAKPSESNLTATLGDRGGFYRPLMWRASPGSALAVVPFEEEDEPPFVGLLRVEAA